MHITGSWDTEMKTPIGTLDALFVFHEDSGALHGTARSRQDEAEMRDLVVTRNGDSEIVTWSQRITKPLRLDLDFTVTVSGDTFSGFSKAGKLPRSAVTGTRAVTA